MIVANLATYPARKEQLRQSLPVISAQVDRVNLVLNEYESVPAWLRDFDNVHPHLPDEDYKDVGKFVFNTPEADAILLLDDDLNYPEDFVATTVARFETLQGRVVAGYHSSNYLPAEAPDAPRPYVRKVKHFRTPQARFLYSDQIATNSAILRPQDMPPLDYMRGSQKFVDVRLAKWSFEQGISHVALPREKWWITQIDVDESIYESFTQTFPPHVDDEILSYALKRPNIGKPVRT